MTIRGQRCLGRFHRELAELKGKMLDNQLDVVGIFFQHLLKYRLQPGAVKSLIVIEYGYGDRRILRTFEGQGVDIDFKELVHTNKPECFG